MQENLLNKLNSLIEEIDVDSFCNTCAHNDTINGCDKGGCANYFNQCDLYNAVLEIVKKLKDGVLKEIPCRPNQYVFALFELIPNQYRIVESKINQIYIDELGTVMLKLNNFWHIPYDENMVFYTREDAERRLKEIQNNESNMS